MSQQRKRPSRLRGKRAFDQVFRQGRFVSQGPLTAMVLPADRPQLGLAVSRKYGNAVERNRFKRRVRAAFINNTGKILSLSVVISPAKGASFVNYSDIDAFVRELFSYGE